jgi:hypothetical protein
MTVLMGPVAPRMLPHLSGLCMSDEQCREMMNMINVALPLLPHLPCRLGPGGPGRPG